jgi:hypothetical protein
LAVAAVSQNHYKGIIVLIRFTRSNTARHLEMLTEKVFAVHERSRLRLRVLCRTRFAGAQRASRGRTPHYARRPAAAVHFKMQHFTIGSTSQVLSLGHLVTCAHIDGIRIDFAVVNCDAETRMVDQDGVHWSARARVE